MVKDKIVVQNVNKCFNQRVKGKEVYALDVVNFSIKKGEFFVLLGPSGCGKTTLLNIMAGFETPTTGKVLIDGKEVTAPDTRHVTMFQEHALLPWRTVLYNVEYGLEMQDLEGEKKKKIVEKYLRLVGLEGSENLRPSEISGGMKQRVQLARTLAVNPDIIFMDEPLGALDHFTRERLQKELIDIWKKEKKTIVLITHNITSAIMLADRIAVMSPLPGRIKRIIDVPIKRPRDRFSSKFIKIEKEIFNEFGINK
jgi:NitT/TauT family transport system ATP-binding protein|tara:strand:+ start:4464 stop:5225 length:762 start_codon:yes stop_codon:yes gene_type:complete